MKAALLSLFLVSFSQKWSCSGYCFLGGDIPTNPWQPVSSVGATEQEARDNIDCGPYQEMGITCKMNETDCDLQS